MFENLISIAIGFSISACMKSSGLLKKYSVEKMALELQKLKNVILQDGREITTEITRKRMEIPESLCLHSRRVKVLMGVVQYLCC